MTNNILFFIPSITRNYGGIFQYAMRILEDIVDTENHIFILNNSEKDFLNQKFGTKGNVTIIPDSSAGLIPRIANKFKRISANLHNELSIFPNFPPQSIPNDILSRYKIDFVHSPYQGYPSENIPFIFTLHDVQELHMPENFTPLERENRAKNNRIGCEKAARIAVSYEHVKQDLIRYFQVNPDKIDVVFIGTSDNSLVMRENTLNIDSEFILYPAATWPHKNHKNLLKAFALAKKNNLDFKPYRLICTGHKTQHYSELKDLIQHLQIEDDVDFKGVVSDKELKELYAEARAVVVPTKYEAGSFPLMESIVQTIPVICSDVTSLPETMDNQKFIFNPDCTDIMAEKIIKIGLDDNFREENVNNSFRRKSELMNIDLTTEFEAIYKKIN